MAGAAAGEMQVPDKVKLLVRLVMRAFYEPVDIVTADVLLRETCVKQDDIATLLQLEEQQVKISLNKLQEDKVVKVRKMEDPRRDPNDTRNKWAQYWNIDYRTVGRPETSSPLYPRHVGASAHVCRRLLRHSLIISPFRCCGVAALRRCGVGTVSL